MRTVSTLSVPVFVLVFVVLAVGCNGNGESSLCSKGNACKSPRENIMLRKQSPLIKFQRFSKPNWLQTVFRAMNKENPRHQLEMVPNGSQCGQPTFDDVPSSSSSENAQSPDSILYTPNAKDQCCHDGATSLETIDESDVSSDAFDLDLVCGRVRPPAASSASSSAEEHDGMNHGNHLTPSSPEPPASLASETHLHTNSSKPNIIDEIVDTMPEPSCLSSNDNNSNSKNSKTNDEFVDSKPGTPPHFSADNGNGEEKVDSVDANSSDGSGGSAPEANQCMNEMYIGAVNWMKAYRSVLVFTDDIVKQLAQSLETLLKLRTRHLKTNQRCSVSLLFDNVALDAEMKNIVAPCRAFYSLLKFIPWDVSNKDLLAAKIMLTSLERGKLEGIVSVHKGLPRFQRRIDALLQEWELLEQMEDGELLQAIEQMQQSFYSASPKFARVLEVESAQQQWQQQQQGDWQSAYAAVMQRQLFDPIDIHCV